ncbi:DNA-binding winged helix-turn-helix (wHTH) protein [Erwinia sp. JUb26]|nr:DNA-binding winged helix-turn-helix (wHTH) protein [Erwinia sp. JUb26]
MSFLIVKFLLFVNRLVIFTCRYPMKYLINNFVEFDSCAGILTLVSDESISVALSKPGSRLLNELITHSGITLSREELLERVWENHGLIPSSNNLSNHISFLRKVFSQIGMEDNIIITSPREGFRLEADVQKFTDSPCEQSESPVNNDRDEYYEDWNKDVVPPVEQSFARRCRTKIIILHLCHFTKREIINRKFIVLTAVLLSLVVIRNGFPGFFYSNGKNATSSIGLCEIVDLASGKGINDKEKVNLVEDIINEKNINCVNKRSRIYLKTTQVTKDTKHNQRSTFLVQCLSGHMEINSTCESYLSLTLQKP